MVFPPVQMADEDGLLAIGGDLSVDRLLLAYKNGIFPWYNEDDPICWWSPDPRCVLFPDKLKISKSMQQVLRQNKFRFTINKNFREVITACKTTNRKDGFGTWINEDIIDAYTNLNKIGIALSAETWMNGNLVGGLYGVKLGNVFFGESMFSTESNASKFAFIKLVQHLQLSGLQIIDCQMKTEHLLSLGAEMIDRKLFLEMIKEWGKG